MYFFIRIYNDSNLALAAFMERGLLGKQFSSKLSKSAPLAQLSDWLSLVRLFSTFDSRGLEGISVSVYPKFLTLIYSNYDEFRVNYINGICQIITNTDVERKIPKYVESVHIPKMWALMDNAENAFWSMVETFKQQVSQKDFETGLKELYKENCAQYIDYSLICKNPWIGVYDINPYVINPSWVFETPHYVQKEDIEFLVQFYENNRVILSGMSGAALQLANASLNRRTHEIIHNGLIIGQIERYDNETDRLTIIMHYKRDANCPNEFLVWGKETPLKYIIKEDGESEDNHFECGYICKRVSIK